MGYDDVAGHSGDRPVSHGSNLSGQPGGNSGKAHHRPMALCQWLSPFARQPGAFHRTSQHNPHRATRLNQNF